MPSLGTFCQDSIARRWNFERLCWRRQDHFNEPLPSTFPSFSSFPKSRNGLSALAISKTEPVSSSHYLRKPHQSTPLPESRRSRLRNPPDTNILIAIATTLAPIKSASPRLPVAPSDTYTSRSAGRLQNAVTAVSNCQVYARHLALQNLLLTLAITGPSPTTPRICHRLPPTEDRLTCIRRLAVRQLRA